MLFRHFPTTSHTSCNQALCKTYDSDSVVRERSVSQRVLRQPPAQHSTIPYREREVSYTVVRPKMAQVAFDLLYPSIRHKTDWWSNMNRGPMYR